MSQAQDLVVVFSGTAAEALVIRVMLEGNGIAAYLEDETLGTMAPHYAAAGGAGAVKVTVMRGDFEAAKTLIENRGESGHEG